MLVKDERSFSYNQGKGHNLHKNNYLSNVVKCCINVLCREFD